MDFRAMLAKKKKPAKKVVVVSSKIQDAHNYNQIVQTLKV
jgi:hypothetical protein